MGCAAWDSGWAGALSAALSAEGLPRCLEWVALGWELLWQRLGEGCWSEWEPPAPTAIGFLPGPEPRPSLPARDDGAPAGTHPCPDSLLPPPAVLFWLWQVENIDRRAGLSLEEFREQYEVPNRPVILTDLVRGGALRCAAVLWCAVSGSRCMVVCPGV